MLKETFVILIGRIKLSPQKGALLMLLIIYSQIAISQCYEYAVSLKAIPNEPKYLLDANNVIINDSNNQITIQVDTLYQKATNRNSILSRNNKFRIYSTYNTKTSTTYIQNIQTSQLLTFCTGDELFSVDLRNCYVRATIGSDKKTRVFIFDYNNSQILTYKKGYRDLIGYDDTCVYMAKSEYKYGFPTLRNETVISLNENGIKKVKSANTKNQEIERQCIFYSNSYKVFESFLYFVEKDCYTEYHYINNVYYLDHLVDSFEVKSGFGTNSTIFKLYNDTFYIESYKQTYRNYYHNLIITKIDFEKWLEKFPQLAHDFSLDNLVDQFKFNGKIESYLLKENIFIFKFSCFYKNMAGLKLINDKLYTLNDIPLKHESNCYSIVLAFDLQKNIILPYPKIEFITMK